LKGKWNRVGGSSLFPLGEYEKKIIALSRAAQRMIEVHRFSKGDHQMCQAARKEIRCFVSEW
jgi:hypothetical protein